MFIKKDAKKLLLTIQRYSPEEIEEWFECNFPLYHIPGLRKATPH